MTTNKNQSCTAAYIHIPFCEHICFYCDFNKVFLQGQPVDEYVELLLKEIQLTRQETGADSCLKTLYIGGGTPTALSAQQLENLLSGVRRLLPLEKNAEFTVEANPGDLTAEKLAVFQKYGVNRLSVGVQTFDDRLLKKIGRKHTAADVHQTIQLIKESGFENVSVDLIYALPSQTMASFEQTLETVLALDLPHYSLYSLILENQTIFANWARQGKLNLPEQEQEAAMFERTKTKLKSAGLHQYEISNFAKQGFESQHNLVYWNNQHYYGFGAGASGYLGKRRYRNHGPIQHYLQPLREGRLPILEEEHLSVFNQMEEEMFLGLRKTAGISLAAFEAKFQRSFDSVYGKTAAALVQKQLLVEKDGFLFLSERGQELGNEVFQEFLLEPS